MKPLNVIPTLRTRALASILIQEAREATGVDAVLNHIDHLDADPDQLYALIGVLLTHTKIHKKAGRPRLRLVFTPEERRAANAAYKKGDRTPEVVAAYREYQRVNQQARRVSKGRLAISERRKAS